MADGNTFLDAAAQIVAPVPPREMQAFKTIFTTLDHADAISAGFDRKEWELGEDGGFAIHFDGRGNIPTVSLELMDGQIVGYHAIKEAHAALGAALAMAARMTGRAA